MYKVFNIYIMYITHAYVYTHTYVPIHIVVCWRKISWQMRENMEAIKKLSCFPTVHP